MLLATVDGGQCSPDSVDPNVVDQWGGLQLRLDAPQRQVLTVGELHQVLLAICG